jgi:hypothetical protein
MVGQRNSMTGIALLLLAQGLAGCGGSDSPAAPSLPPPDAQPPVTQPPAIQLVVFTDPVSGFSTPAVRDVQEQIVHFNTAGEMIWKADGTRFPELVAHGNFIGYHHAADRIWQVRFGTKHGERRAYLTVTDDRLNGAAATLLDLSVDGRGDLVVAETSVLVPGT